MAAYRNRECMFCHEHLGATVEHPENLAFIDHVESHPQCYEQFQGWTRNMASDFKGD